MGILFFQNSGGAGVRIPLGGRLSPLLLYPLDDTNTICVLMHSYGRTDYCVCVWHVNEM